jgi:GNAT superfamily N-acetyltransferase
LLSVTAATPSASLVELSRKWAPEIIEVFVAAHESDADFARAFWGADAVPADALRRIFRAAHAQQITACAPLAVVESGAVVAVANYVLPSRWGSLNPGDHLYAWWTGLGCLALPRRVRGRLRWYSRMAFRLLPYQPRCMITQLAVTPSAQGHGYARALLDAVLERSRTDPLSTGVAITTYSESNVRRYEHLGFQVTGQARSESTSVWALFAAH